jgi:acyl carrier protein
MRRNEIVERVTGIVAQEANITLEDIDLDTKLDSIEIDSLDMIKVAAAIEKDFNITIVTADLMQMDTFGDIVNGLESKLALS